MAKDAPGMKGMRSRNETGRLRKTRGDKQVRSLEKQYGKDFGVRGDMKIETLLKRKGVESVNDLLRGGRGK